MKVCSRCRSENNSSIKYCNFCGARLRSPLPIDTFAVAPVAQPSQVVPIAAESYDTKLAYRYFLKGQHAFSAGDLERATLMFQCALDANPADGQVKSFLQRVVEAKRQRSRAAKHSVYSAGPIPLAAMPQQGLSSVSQRPEDLQFRDARNHVEGKVKKTPSLRVIRPVSTEAPVAVNPPRTAAPVAVNPPPEKVESEACLALLETPAKRAEPVAAASAATKAAEPVAAASVAEPVAPAVSRPAWLDSPKSKTEDDFLAFAGSPLSPSEQLDCAPPSEPWKDIFASALVVVGLIVFAWVLVL